MPCLLILLPLLVFPSATTTDEDSEAVLESLGVAVQGSILRIDGESEFRTELARAPKLKKGVTDAAGSLALGQRQMAALQQQISQLTVANVDLNSRLARINPSDIATNNQLVGMINANTSRLQLLAQQIETGRTQLDQLRAEATQLREEFIEYVRECRKSADAITATREAAAEDPDVQAALAKLNEDGDRSYTLAEPSRSFERSLRTLEGLEKLITTEEIAVRREASGTAMVTAMVNGKHAVDMVVDSGASVICLPLSLAEQVGARPGANDPPIRIELADGREIRGSLVRLKTVRVGSFELENVECAVLGPEAVNASPLLGMSFLQNFKFEINAAEQTMTLTKMNESSSRSGRSRR